MLKMFREMDGWFVFLAIATSCPTAIAGLIEWDLELVLIGLAIMAGVMLIWLGLDRWAKRLGF